MKEVREKKDLRIAIKEARANGKSIGLVPTMGYLHEGHLSLVRRSVKECGYTVASIFVNPTQFGPNEDLDQYPRDYQNDYTHLKKENVDLLYYPDQDSLYGKGYSTWVIEDQMSKILCGRSRPIHFKGVLTIVAKLLNLVQPDYAYFGQKDYQQARLIIKMVRELEIPTEIVVCPTIRESDGLAMSSRNTYLSELERQDALVFSRTLFAIDEAFQNGETNIKSLLRTGLHYFDRHHGEARREYLEILDTETLQEINKIENSAVVLIAGKSGTTRLIDNIILTKGSSKE